MADNLDDWLTRVQQLHPTEIELGLSRVSEVALRMGLLPVSIPCITVAGTNGKGSCVATLEALLVSHGLRVGCHTSPHLLRYNERIRIDGQMADDGDIIEAFGAIDVARDGIPLTYFEFGTLAALYLFSRTALDFLVLEVGLGGRLDAVNIVDAEVAIISSIDLDHQQWLGNDREQIGREKAGIFRRGQSVVIGDPDPPASVLQHAASLDCRVHRLGIDFHAEDDGAYWHWRGRNCGFDDLPRAGLLPGNIACAIQAALLLPISLQLEAVRDALNNLLLPGRQELRRDPHKGRELMLDVAHNPHAAAALARRLQTERAGGRRVHLLLAMMADKDVEGFVMGLESVVDFWYSAQVDQSRCLPAEKLHLLLRQQRPGVLYGPFRSVAQAYDVACDNSRADDLIVVCGSFFTVSDMMQVLDDLPPRHPGR